jgi:predicted O-methyltransferase YrrM
MVVRYLQSIEMKNYSKFKINTFKMSGKRDKIIQLTGNAKDILENLDESYDIVFYRC